MGFKQALILTTCLSFLSFPLVAQTNDLTLKVGGESIVIGIEGEVRIISDGSLEATATDPNACQTPTPTCESVTVEVTSFLPTGEQAPQVSITEGEDFSVEWRALGATTCTPTGAWSKWTARGALPPDSRDASSSQKLVETQAGDGSTGPYKLGLTCANGTVQAAESAVITVDVAEPPPEPEPGSCDGRGPIKGWTRLTTGSLSCELGRSSSDCRTWEPTLWTSAFLETNGQSRKLLTNVTAARQYVAIEFSTAKMSSTARGKFDIESAGATVQREPVLATISQCPGDFTPEQETGCYGFLSGLIPYSWRAADGSNEGCRLEPNTRYYLNLLATRSKFGTVPDEIEPIGECEDARCGLLFVPRNSN